MKCIACSSSVPMLYNGDVCIKCKDNPKLKVNVTGPTIKTKRITRIECLELVERAIRKKMLSASSEAPMRAYLDCIQILQDHHTIPPTYVD